MFNFSKIHNYLYLSKRGFYDLVFDLLSYLHIKIYLAFFLLVNVLVWGVAFYIDSELDSEQIALHYNVDFGIDFYGDKNKIYIIPFLGLLIILLNFLLLANFSRNRDRKFISHILLVTALVSNIILLGAIISVYLINFW